MTHALSLYLDAVRFGAAFTVLLSHYGTGRISGGALWYVANYGRAAVLVFFVLSGFVIAWVTEAREGNLEDYALSRLARLYSVIIPTFLLTAMLDCAGKTLSPRSYGPEWRHATAHPLLDYLLSAAFLGESWNARALPGFNVPYWSLNYEAWYYALFGIAVFLRGRARAASLAAVALIAGPKILLLLPVWLMGVAAWRWRSSFPGRFAWLLVCLSLTILIGLEALGGERLFWHPAGQWLPPGYSAYDYVIGMLVALSILGLANLRLPVPGARVERVVRWLAGTSFGLYSFHYPLLNYFGTVVPGPPDKGGHRILVFALVLGTAVGLAYVIEPRKREVKHALRSALDALHAKHSQRALARQRLS
jgi:peptidoglycan/LPS O-acetylase OafA/YrhL